MRIEANRWHHNHCDGCEKMWCPEHRLLFMWCNTATWVPYPEQRGLWDGGECPRCKQEARAKMIQAKFDKLIDSIRRVA